MFSIIAAIGKNNELGKDNKLIFKIKDDMTFFKEKTSGHKIVMGHKTWDSLPGKLKNRENIVISRHDFPGPDQIIHDLDAFIQTNQNTDEEIYIDKMLEGDKEARVKKMQPPSSLNSIKPSIIKP